MREFILAALPFIIIGLSIAIIMVNDKKNKESYICEGMCLGMSLGLLIGNSFSNQYLGMYISLGMLIGETIGSYINKDK